MEKVCPNCKTSLPVESFKSNAKRSDGRQPWCVEYHRVYRRNHYLKHREKYMEKARARTAEFKRWFFEYKSQFSCSECGETRVYCIDFHHHNDDKESNVSTLVTLGNKKKVIDEISKCIPLCKNCHAEHHWMQRNEDNKLSA